MINSYSKEKEKEKSKSFVKSKKEKNQILNANRYNKGSRYTGSKLKKIFSGSHSSKKITINMNKNKEEDTSKRGLISNNNSNLISNLNSIANSKVNSNYPSNNPSFYKEKEEEIIIKNMKNNHFHQGQFPGSDSSIQTPGNVSKAKTKINIHLYQSSINNYNFLGRKGMNKPNEKDEVSNLNYNFNLNLLENLNRNSNNPNNVNQVWQYIALNPNLNSLNNQANPTSSFNYKSNQEYYENIFKKNQSYSSGKYTLYQKSKNPSNKNYNYSDLVNNVNPKEGNSNNFRISSVPAMLKNTSLFIAKDPELKLLADIEDRKIKYYGNEKKKEKESGKTNKLNIVEDNLKKNNKERKSEKEKNVKISSNNVIRKKSKQLYNRRKIDAQKAAKAILENQSKKLKQESEIKKETTSKIADDPPPSSTPIQNKSSFKNQMKKNFKSPLAGNHVIFNENNSNYKEKNSSTAELNDTNFDYTSSYLKKNHNKNKIISKSNLKLRFKRNKQKK